MSNLNVNPTVLQGRLLFPFVAPANGGKGTQTKILSQRHNLPIFDMGATFRQILKNESETPLAKEIKQYMDAGDLVPVKTVVKVFAKGVEDLAAKHQQAKGFILDGFPRDLDQAKALVDLCKQWGATLAKAIYLSVPEDIVRQRSTGRRICPQGEHRTYNVFNPQFQPKQKKLNPDGTVAKDADGQEIWLCDDDQTELIIRKDDRPEAVEKRIQSFKNETMPVVDYFRQLDLNNSPNDKILVQIEGDQKPDEVTAEIEKEIQPALGLSGAAS